MQTDMTRVARWVQPEDILVDVDLRSVEEVLECIAAAVGARRGLESPPILRALSRREQAGSTGLGGGFAIPHARIAGIERPITLLLRARNPIPFRAVDGEPVSLVLAILVPEQGDKSDHLQLLALVAELFASRLFRARIEASTQAAEIARAFRDGVSQLLEASPT